MVDRYGGQKINSKPTLGVIGRNIKTKLGIVLGVAGNQRRRELVLCFTLSHRNGCQFMTIQPAVENP